MAMRAATVTRVPVTLMAEIEVVDMVVEEVEVEEAVGEVEVGGVVAEAEAEADGTEKFLARNLMPLAHVRSMITAQKLVFHICTRYEPRSCLM